MQPKDIADAILGCNDVATVMVPTPEWPIKEVCLRELTALERDQFDESVSKVKKVKDKRGRIKREAVPDVKLMRAKLVMMSAIVSPTDHRPIFNAGHLKKLGEKSGKVMDRLFDEARKLSGLSDTEIEELEGNESSGTESSSG